MRVHKLSNYILLTALAMSACVSSCNNKGDSDHLPPKEMQKILLDISVAESYSAVVKDSLHKQQGAKNMDSLAVYYKDILAHYHITEEEFAESLDWYKSNPGDLDSMYTALIPIANKWQSALPVTLPKGGPTLNVRP